MADEPLALAIDELRAGGGSTAYPAALRDAYAVFEFAGQGKGDPSGVKVDGARVGLMTLPPGTVYPAHSHPAPEVYVVVAGRCRWSAGDRTRDLAAVSFAYHPPGVEHAIEVVGNESLHIVYVWWGDPAVLATDARLSGGSRWPG